MATIGTTTFLEDGIKNFIELRGVNLGEQYFRRLNIDDNWTKIAIGCTCAIHATGSIVNSSGIAISLCTSTSGSGGFKTRLAGNQFMVTGGNGIIPNLYSAGGFGANPWTYTTTVTGSFLTTGGYGCVAISGGTVIAQSAFGANSVLTTTELPERKSVIILNITRATSTTVQVMLSTFASQAGAFNRNYTDHSLFSVLNMGHVPYFDDTPALTNTASPSTLTGWNSTTHPLNTINIFWTGSVPLRIYDIGAVIQK